MARPRTFLEALENLRGLRDSELTALLEAAAQGEPDAIEWADARLLDLQFAHEQLREIVLEGVRGGLVSITEAADELGMTVGGLHKRLARAGIPTIEAPSYGRGPKKMRYLSREAVEAMGKGRA